MRLNRHYAAFAALLVLSLFLGGRSLFDTLSLAIRDNEYTHILLILPMSAALILLERPWQRFASTWNLRLGLPLLVSAAAIAVGALLWPDSLSADVRLSIDTIALVLSWIGAFVLCLGGVAARSVLFPLLFLFGLIPLPQRILESVIALLQAGSAWSAHALFVIFGVPVVQSGNLLTIPSLVIQVAQECSSIRSSTMLLVTTIVLAHLLLRTSWRKIFVACLAIPLSVAKNGLRIFTIAMLGTRVDPGYLNGKLHHQGGVLFFLIALLGIFLVLIVCQKRESSSLKAGSPDKLRFYGI